MPASSVLLGQLLLLSVPGYFILQCWLARSWTGRWRIVALVPLLAVVPVMIFSVFALSKGSNLWPMMVVLVAPFGCIDLHAAWGWRTIME